MPRQLSSSAYLANAGNALRANVVKDRAKVCRVLLVASLLSLESASTVRMAQRIVCPRNAHASLKR